MDKIKPDPETLERCINLSRVGVAINSTQSESGFGTNFFVARESLNKFKEGVDKLDLSPEIVKGITDLINYLHKKIDKRANAV
ncbi:MAG: hypothetical protein Q9M91_02830 [Candidatus Dojkabacteria bacterium]|nr:hypothetical protein [Candidatus Dojkabacteria bacterium]MDQ7020759.1 hypothetical protein [Candidatus Dojkabacteria bacterium]